MLNWMGRTALELIGQAGLGYSFDPLQEDVTPDVFAEAIKAYVSVICSSPAGLRRCAAAHRTRFFIQPGAI